MTIRGRDASKALTEIRTVLSRAETARTRLDQPTEYQLRGDPCDKDDIDFAKPKVDDPDAQAMRDALDQVIGLLYRWRKTGKTVYATPLP